MSVVDDMKLVESLSSLDSESFYKELPLAASGYSLVFRLADKQEHIPNDIRDIMVFLSRVYLNIGFVSDFKYSGSFSLDVPFLLGSLVTSCINVLQKYLKENDISIIVSKSMHTEGVLDCFNVMLRTLDNYVVSPVAENNIITLNFTSTVSLIEG